MAPWSGGGLLQVLSYIVITCNYNKNKAPRWEVTFYIQVQQEISYIKVCPHKMSHVYVNDAIMGIFSGTWVPCNDTKEKHFCFENASYHFPKH